MRKRKHKLSLGSVFFIIIIIMVALGCMWLFPKLFNEQITKIDVNKANNTIAELLKIKHENYNSSNVVDNKTPNAQQTSIPKNQSDYIDVTLSFGGYFSFDKIVKQACENNNGDIDILNLFKNINYFNNDDFSAISLSNIPEKADSKDSLIIMDSLYKSGIDYLAIGGNNLLNSGPELLNKTLKSCIESGITPIGIAKNDNHIKLLNIKDVKIAILQYSQSLSSIGKKFVNDSLNIAILSNKQIKVDIDKAKTSGAKYIIANVVWDKDFENSTTIEKIKLTQMLANSGADLIIATNQSKALPATLLTAFNADGTKSTVPVVYSLGSIVNSSRDNVENISSIVLKINLKFYKNKQQLKSVNLDYLPIYIWKNSNSGYDKYLLVDPRNDYDQMDDIQADYKNKALNHLNEVYKNLPIVLIN